MRKKMRRPSSISTKTIIVLVFIAINLIGSQVFGSLYSYQREGLKSVSKRDIPNVGVTYEVPGTQLNNLAGKPGEGYYLEVEIGIPKQKLNVLIDTGSSNLAIACKTNVDLKKFFHRNESSTFKELGRSVNVPYTQGSWNGILGQDHVTITSLPKSTVFATIACIDQADGFFINNSNWQGIMGLAFAGIARPDSSVEPIYDTMVKDGIVKNKFSVALCGMGSHSNNTNIPMGGSVIFGGTDQSLYTGRFYSTPIEKQWYYDVVIVDILVNNQSLGMDCKEYNFGKTIVDTGTTNMRLPQRVFDKLVLQIKSHLLRVPDMPMPGPGFWSGDEVLCWHTGKVPYEDWPIFSVTLPINNTAAFRLDVSSLQYLRPVGEENDSSPEEDCYKFGISSIDSGTVIGAVIMEGFYVVFDRENNTVDFATSTCSHYVKSAPKSVVIGNIPFQGNYKDCAYIKPLDTPNKTLTVVGYVLAGVCGVCVVPLLTLVVYMNCRQCKKCRSRKNSSDIDYSDLMETR